MQHRVDQTHAHLCVRVGAGWRWFKLPNNENPQEKKDVNVTAFEKDHFAVNRKTEADGEVGWKELSLFV